MLDSIQLTLVDADRKNKTLVFEPTKLMGFAFRNRQTIALTIIDGKEDLFFSAMQHPHTVMLYSDNSTVTVRFTLGCNIILTKGSRTAHIAEEIIYIEPSHEDLDLFTGSEFIRMNSNGKVERQIAFTCCVSKTDNIDAHVSDR